jgi:hypothetical protein
VSGLYPVVDYGVAVDGALDADMMVFAFHRSSSRRSRVSRTTSRSWGLIWRADYRLRATRRARTKGRTRTCLYSAYGSQLNTGLELLWADESLARRMRQGDIFTLLKRYARFNRRYAWRDMLLRTDTW